MNTSKKSILVTGGAGFIGSCFVHKMVHLGHTVVVLDALTYAGHPENLTSLKEKSGFHFVLGNICDGALVLKLLKEHKINYLVNFAAESHVDRSIETPGDFIQTNLVGTFTLLKASLDY